MVHARLAGPAYQVEITAGGHPLLADEPKANGGADTGPSPFDLVLSGLAACTLITLRMYAERKGWTGFDISAQLRHRMEGATHFIDRKVEVSGVPDEAGIERLRDIVERTPVTLALKPGFTISTVLSQVAAENTPGARA
jgi:putative redox protein